VVRFFTIREPVSTLAKKGAFGSMKAEHIDQIVQEILTDITQRKRDAATKPETAAIPFAEDVIEEFIQEDDETGKDVMRKIWRELLETQQAGRM
jgi:hypothetical protein